MNINMKNTNFLNNEIFFQLFYVELLGWKLLINIAFMNLNNY